jgi:hypothetical protein
MLSHETICILNAGPHDAQVVMIVFYEHQDPLGPYRILVPARRTKHARLNNLADPTPIPTDTNYANVIESDVPIVVQHTRLDSRQTENALLSTIAFAESE